MKSGSIRATACFCLLLLTRQCFAGTFTVTTAKDSGPGSLRWAFQEVNSGPGPHVIQFGISGPGVSGVHTIAPLTALPDILNPVTVDGYSQPGSRPNTLEWGNDAVLKVRLDGLNLTNALVPALTLRTGNSTVRGLIVVRFPFGIKIDSGGGNIIAGNWIGMDFDGIARGMTFEGVSVTSSGFGAAMGNLIGGGACGDRNVISGNFTGVSFFPDTAGNNSVVGNFIGTDPSGRLPRGNIFEGVLIQSADNIQVRSNVLAASTGAGGSGIHILGASGVTIQGNLIGLSVTGHDLGHFSSGILAMDARGLRIGALGGAAGNFIDCNRSHGIDLQSCSGAIVQGNVIGSASSGSEPLGNLGCGIYLFGCSSNQIGPGNGILYNGRAGIAAVAGIANTFSENHIYDNGGLGIDLGDNGVTVNDPGDIDAGANQLQNHPELTSAHVAAGSIQIKAILQSEPARTYRLEFFANSAWDPLWVPEGQIVLGSIDLTTDSSGDGKASFSGPAPVWLTESHVVTATATDAAGNTSEFSGASAVTIEPPPPALTISQDDNGVMVSWPSTTIAPGFRLESTTDVYQPDQWQTVTAGITDDGVTCRLMVTNPSEQSPQFFRLARP